MNFVWSPGEAGAKPHRFDQTRERPVLSGRLLMFEYVVETVEPTL